MIWIRISTKILLFFYFFILIFFNGYRDDELAHRFENSRENSQFKKVGEDEDWDSVRCQAQGEMGSEWFLGSVRPRVLAFLIQAADVCVFIFLFNFLMDFYLFFLLESHSWFEFYIFFRFLAREKRLEVTPIVKYTSLSLFADRFYRCLPRRVLHLLYIDI